MLNTLVKNVFGSRNERVLKRLGKQVVQINALEPELQALSDADLAAKTDAFRSRLQAGESMDTILPEAFAVVREASCRVMGMRHFDVQLIGGMVLHGGKIAEMRTGEGKTLMATLPTYLNALSGKGVHIVTVNDYLAQRDADWMRPLYQFLGLTVGAIISDMSPEDRREAYAADITYGTNNEFGFDYLRDNMAFSLEERVQRPLHYAVIDEVDSILIDEARTPLIISGSAEDSSELYKAIDHLVPQLKAQVGEPEEGVEPDGDYTLDEKQKQIHLTDAGHQHAEQLLQEAGLLQAGDSLYSAQNIILMHHLNAALRAHALFHANIDYIVSSGEVVIVDEHTGRTMPGRRWSEGLHQAVEAKEGVAIQNENQTLASITFQNYFRIYEKISGMTGTADTEAYEFQQIYSLEVVVIPTNKPMVRRDEADLVFLNQSDKFNAIIDDIKDCVERKQPVLVGTASIETSELLSNALQKAKLPHQVLNAKFHEKEAHIVSEAGRPGSVTIATNMAGRGTDIVLGGNVQAEIAALDESASEADKQALQAAWQQRHDAVLAAGGLRIIGTERHESRRIDNQLRGRAGRQGDPGSSRFYLSLEDNLLRIFASDRVASIMQRLGMKAGEAIEHNWVTKAIENAQRKVEGHNFDIRKQLLEYDDVANDQRKVIYEQRSDIMATDDLSEHVTAIRETVLQDVVALYMPLESLEEQWSVPELEQSLQDNFALSLPVKNWLAEDNHLDPAGVARKVVMAAHTHYDEKVAPLDQDNVRAFEKAMMLQTLDTLWREHLAAMDHLRQGIHLRGFAQKDPKQEYKREAYELFAQLLERLKYDVTSILMMAELAPNEAPVMAAEPVWQGDLNFEHAAFAEPESAEGMETVAVEGDEDTTVQPFTRGEPKVGRNDPCPCGSGKKYKKCHGRLQ